LLHHRHPPALRLQAGELTRSNRTALLPDVEVAAGGACECWQSAVWWVWSPDQLLILVKPWALA